MSIDIETAALIETLARATSVIVGTPASAKINRLIVNMLPDTADDESIAEALRQDNAALQQELTSVQNSARTMAENLELLRDRMEQINQLINKELLSIDEVDLLKTLSAPIDA